MEPAEKRLVHKVDPKEDVGIDRDQVAESVPKQVLVKVEVHTGLA